VAEEEQSLKVFVDANVLFSAAYRLVNTQRSLLQKGGTKGLRFFTCDYAIDEAKRNLQRKAPAALDRLPSVLEACHLAPTVFQGEAPLSLPAKDLPIWLSALAAGCEVLLTGDKKDFGKLKHPKIKVMGPGELFDEVFG
jgi:uncharacterized protein